MTRSILHQRDRSKVRNARSPCWEGVSPGPGTLLRRLRNYRHGAVTPMDAENRTDVDSEALFDEWDAICCHTMGLRAS